MAVEHGCAAMAWKYGGQPEVRMLLLGGLELLAFRSD